MSLVSTIIHSDASEGTVTFQRVQDVEAILENNKRLQNEAQGRAETFHHVGTIPNIILERWMKEDGVNYLALSGEEFGKLVFKKLRDPDWAWLRTTDKRF